VAHGQNSKPIWEALLDQGKVAWDRCLKSIKLSPSTERKLLEAMNHVVCVKLENYVGGARMPSQGVSLVRFVL
jgi:hypothetical protein